MDAHQHDASTVSRSGRLGARLAFGVFLAVAAVLLILEHQAHLLRAWPLLFLGACLVMHFVMHRGHGKGAGHGH